MIGKIAINDYLVQIEEYWEDYRRNGQKLLSEINSLLGVEDDSDRKFVYTPYILFFVGNLKQSPKGSIVLLSLNPSFNPRRTPQQMNACKKYEDWISEHLSFFNTPKYIKHTLFKKFKLIMDNIEGVQIDNLINLDICPFYSQTTRNLGLLFKWSGKRVRKRKNLKTRRMTSVPVSEAIIKEVETWNRLIKGIIGELNPKCVFLHGKAFEEWLSYNNVINDFKSIEKFSRGKEIFSEAILNGVPYFWLKYFMGSRPMLKYLQDYHKDDKQEFYPRIGEYINQKIININKTP